MSVLRASAYGHLASRQAGVTVHAPSKNRFSKLEAKASEYMHMVIGRARLEGLWLF